MLKEVIGLWGYAEKLADLECKSMTAASALNNGTFNQAPGEIPFGLLSAPRFDTWITSKYPLATYLAWEDFLKSGHSRDS
jgi:hypothetical protein